MTQHKKFDMLVAKGTNMDLIILLKYPELKHWEVSPNAYPPHKESVEAFLCHPLHLDACLKCLNGGGAEILLEEGEWGIAEIKESWHKDGWYMSSDVASRI